MMMSVPSDFHSWRQRLGGWWSRMCGLRISSYCQTSFSLPLGFSSTRRQATLFSSPTTKATSPDSSVVTIFRTKRCTRPWLLIWFRSLFWRRLSPSHHSPFVTPRCDNSTSKTASCPVVTVISQSSRRMRTRSEGEWVRRKESSPRHHHQTYASGFISRSVMWYSNVVYHDRKSSVQLHLTKKTKQIYSTLILSHYNVTTQNKTRWGWVEDMTQCLLRDI